MKSSTTGDRNGRRVPRVVVGPEECWVQKDMMRETLEELLRENPAFKRIVAGLTAPEETRTVVTGPSGGGHGK